MLTRHHIAIRILASGWCCGALLLALSLFLLGFAQPSVMAQVKQEGEFSPDDLEFFEKQVRPILANRCFECHGPEVDDPEGKLQMVSREAILSGGETGPAIDLEHPDKSLLVEAINYSGLYEMPPDSKLPDAEIETLTEWVKRGLPWPPTEQTAAIGPKKFDLEARRSEHWCWQPIANPEPPRVSQAAWIRQPLDAFVLSELDKNKLRPAPEADPRTLIRRLYFDLIGLPPSPAEVDEFLKDTSADAYEKLVDRVLASPRFGEHWARRWMDLVRYAETYGHEYDYPLPHAHQYRDYLIRAFNADVPYDQFIREHVAGDLLPEPRLNSPDHFNESIVATGFWFLGEATHGPVDVRGDEAGRFDNQIDVFGKTFLGLTVACARCHDHMFDAIAARDYYGLVGFMQSSRRQLAMLDYGHKIDSAASDLAERQLALDAKCSEYRQSLNGVPRDELAKYFAAALECISKDGPFSKPQTVKFQGEEFATTKPSGGQVTVQELAAVGDTRWDADKQLWWLDGKIGDQLAIEFSVAADGQYDLVADFTKARDYGIVKIRLDDEVIAEKIDLFAPELGKTGQQALATPLLAAGKHVLQIELIGTNKVAAPKFMFGLDYFELRAHPDELFTNLKRLIDGIAKEQSLDPKQLGLWVRALRDPRLNESDHPLYVLQQILRNGGLGDPAARAEVIAQVQRKRDEAQKLLEESPTFADFNDPKLPGWFRTGWAFDDSETPQWSVDNSQTAGQQIGRAGTVSSGRKGTPLYGVLRSPTFTLDHKFIHYRLAGREAQVRLIIDGFTLDTFNSLLFNGMSLNVDSPNRFTWLAQGQDVGNYSGHRAHLEIIDHSGGSIAVDEIRFSDHPTLADVPSDFAADLFADLPADAVFEPLHKVAVRDADEPTLAGLAEQLVRRICQQIEVDKPDTSGTALLDWVLHWNLVVDPTILQCRESIEQQLNDRQEWLRESRVPAPVFAQAIADGTGENEYVLVRGNHKTPGPEATRRMIQAIPTSEGFEMTPENGSGRLRLANAVASMENPLTTRVIANRLWHHLFGRGLVASVDNFGVLGERPSHSELLDHLATSFAEHGWSIKKTLRMIATSATYRMSSQMDPAAEEADPDNVLLHRANVRRLSSESIRDSILQAAGNLDTTMYGPSVPIYLTPFLEGRGRPGESGPLDGNRRRSVYIEVRRNFLSPMMLTFDTPSPFNAIGRRNVSNVPSQALMLLNHPFVLQQSEVWAKRLLADEKSEAGRLDRLFQEAFARIPQPDEITLAQEFLDAQRRQLVESGSSGEQNALFAWRDLCHVLINAKEFYYVH